MSNITKQLVLIFSIFFLLLLLLGILTFNVANRFKESTAHIQEQTFPEIVSLNQIENIVGLRKLTVIHYMLSKDPVKKAEHKELLKFLTAENDKNFETLSGLITAEKIRTQLNIVLKARTEYQEQTNKILILFENEEAPDPAEYEENILRPFYLRFLNELNILNNMVIADASETISGTYIKADESERLAYLVIVLGSIFLVIAGYKISGLFHRLKTDARKLKDFNKLLEERMYFLAESMPFMVWTADPQGNINYYSKKWEEYTGYDIETLKKESWIKIVHPDFLESTKEIYIKWNPE
ncbi:MAG: MCP four helix bundle domain-containing protein [Bacteroidetes bacterium]|nr:MCP four helix bundle domain-containing protein [Bacteroidota bacterium]